MVFYCEDNNSNIDSVDEHDLCRTCMIQHYQYHGGTIHDIQIDTHISRITWNTYIRDEGYRRNIKRITELLLNSCTIAPFLSWSAVAMYLPGTIVSSEQTSRQQQQQH